MESVGEFRLRSRGPIVSTTGSGNDEFEASEAIRNDGEIGVLRDSNSGLSKVMMQVYLASEIQEMNLQMEIVEPILTGLTAAEAVNYLVRDHLLNEQEIDQLYNLLNQLELP